MIISILCGLSGASVKGVGDTVLYLFPISVSVAQAQNMRFTY